METQQSSRHVMIQSLAKVPSHLLSFRTPKTGRCMEPAQVTQEPRRARKERPQSQLSPQRLDLCLRYLNRGAPSSRAAQAAPLLRWYSGNTPTRSMVRERPPPHGCFVGPDFNARTARAFPPPPALSLRIFSFLLFLQASMLLISAAYKFFYSVCSGVLLPFRRYL